MLPTCIYRVLCHDATHKNLEAEAMWPMSTQLEFTVTTLVIGARLSTFADVRGAECSYRRFMTSRLAATSVTAVRIAALTVAALVATALPAIAEETFHRDDTGDVLLLGVEDDSVTPQPAWEPGDIKRVGVTHGSHRVAVRLAFRDVAQGTDSAYFYRIRTPHRRFMLAGFTARDEPQGEWFLLSPSRERPVNCKGLRHRIDYANEQVKVSVPRGCIGHPDRVRVGAHARTTIDAKEQTRLDDAYSTGPVERITLGPWLRRC